MPSETFLIYTALVAGVIALASWYISAAAAGRKVLTNEGFQKFPLIRKQKVNHNTSLFTFGLPRVSDVLGLPIGQHIQVTAEINGKKVLRSYTPTSLDQDTKGEFNLLVKVYPDGNISKHIDSLEIGDALNVRGPKGFFTYTPNMVSEIGMIAGGTGITPMYQIIKAICSDPEDKTVVNLLYANVSEEDILLRDELDELAANNTNIHIYNVLNNPPKDWKQGSGYIDLDLMKEKLAKPSDNVKLLLCGPPPMVSAMKKNAVSLGYQKAKPISHLQDQVFVF